MKNLLIASILLGLVACGSDSQVTVEQLEQVEQTPDDSSYGEGKGLAERMAKMREEAKQGKEEILAEHPEMRTQEFE